MLYRGGLRPLRGKIDGVRIASDLTQAKTPTFVALGNFDGVHLGHRRVIQPAADLRAEGDGIGEVTAGGDSAVRPLSTVVTFAPHPREFFSGQQRSLLTPVSEKAQQLEALGIEQLVLLPFDAALAKLSPGEFVEQILLQGLDCRSVSIGADFHFGAGRTGNAEGLRGLLEPRGIGLNVVALYPQGGDRISSSRIRAALEAGEIAAVEPLLGRRYALQGEVVQGKQLGRTIGFPTANLALPERKFVPRLGVYAVEVSSLASSGDSVASENVVSDSAASIATLLHRHPAVMNIGVRPTVSGEGVTVEVHLLDWQGDLYGQQLRVELVQFLRPEQKFDGLDGLKAQILADADQARQCLRSLEVA